MTDLRAPLIATADEQLLDDGLRWCAAMGVVPELAVDVTAVRRSWRQASVIVVGHDLAGELAQAALPRREHVLIVADDPDQWWSVAVALGAVAVCGRREDDRIIEVLAAALDGREEACVVAVVAGCGGAGASTLTVALGIAACRRRSASAGGRRRSARWGARARAGRRTGRGAAVGRLRCDPRPGRGRLAGRRPAQPPRRVVVVVGSRGSRAAELGPGRHGGRGARFRPRRGRCPAAPRRCRGGDRRTIGADAGAGARGDRRGRRRPAGAGPAATLRAGDRAGERRSAVRDRSRGGLRGAGDAGARTHPPRPEPAGCDRPGPRAGRLPAAATGGRVGARRVGAGAA